MFLGKVVGTIVASQKEEKLIGLKFLAVRRLTIEGQETEYLFSRFNLADRLRYWPIPHSN